jgi:ferredoxin-NADP reductase
VTTEPIRRIYDLAMAFSFLKRSKPAYPTTTVTSYDPVADIKASLAKAASSAAHQTFDLVVDAVTREADDVIAITLTDPVAGELPAWSPGAHLEIHLPSGLLRHYSLCGDPSDRESYRVAVLREEAGRGGSKELHDLDLVGQILTATGPHNHFELVDSPDYLFIAGGIGITPILAMIGSVPAGSTWKLLYGGRSRGSMAFLDELAPFGDRVQVVPQDEAGMLDLASALSGLGQGTAVYCCGPAGLISAVEGLCVENPGIDLHFERFTASEGAAAVRAEKAKNDAPFELELRQTGVTITVAHDETALDAILKVVPDYPFSCEEGHCGSCPAKILEGGVDHRDEAQSEAERAENTTMYVCVSRATSDRVVLDA